MNTNSPPLGTGELLHQRDLPGVISSHRLEWEHHPTKGMYFIEHRLPTTAAGDAVPILLIPGGFDPVKGSYRGELIMQLLSEPGIGEIYEAHYRHESHCGYIVMQDVMDDLARIVAESRRPPIIISLSASTFAMAAALYDACQKVSPQRTRAVLMVGPYLPGYQTFLAKLLGPYYRRRKMRDKVAAFCGHPYFYDNADRMLAWWETFPRFRRALEERRFEEIHSRCTVPVEMLFFRYDTLRRSGQQLITRALNATVHPTVIPGHHRGLHKLPEADTLLIDFCRRHLTDARSTQKPDISPPPYPAASAPPPEGSG